MGKLKYFTFLDYIKYLILQYWTLAELVVLFFDPKKHGSILGLSSIENYFLTTYSLLYKQNPLYSQVYENIRKLKQRLLSYQKCFLYKIYVLSITLYSSLLWYYNKVLFQNTKTSCNIDSWHILYISNIENKNYCQSYSNITLFIKAEQQKLIINSYSFT